MSIINVYATDDFAEEGRSTASLTFTRDSAVGSETINFSLAGTAVAGADYEAIGSSVTFADGQDSVTLFINPLVDLTIDDKESIICTIDTSSNYTVGVGSAEVTLRDKDYVGDGYIAPLDETFNLHSNPDAEHTVYIDFFGGTYKYHPSGTHLTVNKFDKDGDSSTFSTAERLEIQHIWAGIAEDFAPFDLNITTEKPADGALIKTDADDDTWGVSLLVGEEVTLGQFAWSGSEFYRDIDLSGYVTTKGSSGWWSTQIVTSGGAHEIAHTMGLHHDGGAYNSAGAYYKGHSTDVGHWTPIMGQSNNGLTQFNAGDYGGANEHQDDLAVITSAQNGIDYRVDDHADGMAFATELVTLDDDYGTLFGQGVIEKTADVDWFVFDHTGGPLVLNIDVADFMANLHAGAWLYDANGQEVAHNSSTNSLSAHIIDDDLAAGRYYLKVDGIGNPSGDGYSDYGSLGHYTVSTGAAVLASFNPDGEFVGTDISGESQLSGVTLSNLSSEGFINVNWDNTWALNWSGSSTLNLSQYISFSVAPAAADKAIIAESLKASFYSWVSGTSEFVLRSDLDNFAADIDVQSITGSMNADTLSFDVSGLGQLTQATEFRIYVKGGGAGYRYLTGDGWTNDERGEGLTLEGRLVDTATVNQNNIAPTGSVVITGNPMEDQVLTVDALGVNDADGLGTFYYQWKADNVALRGETGQSLSLGQEHVGKQISVDVKFKDTLGTLETVSSSQTAAIGNINDAPTGTVIITGRPNVGNDLSVDISQLTDEDGVDASTLSYQWLRDGVDIGGATSSTYTLVEADLQELISVRVGFDDKYAYSESVTSAEAVAIREALPTLETLVTYLPDYQKAEGVVSASTNSADVTVSDLTSDNHYGPGIDNVWALYWNGENLDLTEYIGFSVTPNAGKDFMAEKLTASFSSEVAGTTKFILRSSIDNFKNDLGTASIAGNNTSSVLEFDLTAMALIEQQVEFRMYAIEGAAGYRKLVGTDFSASDANEGLSLYGRIVTEDTPTGDVLLKDATGALATGSSAQALAQGDTLTADASGVTDPQGIDTSSYTYTWYRSGSIVDGATAQSYTLTANDVGKTISVKVGFTDNSGTIEAIQSTSTATILATNTAVAGDVTITTDGAYDQGDTLTANNTLTDADGIGSISYQWLRDGAEIAGATKASYSLSQADVGSAISVRASYTDDLGFNESKTSAATSTVGNVNDVPTGSVSIQGQIVSGATLSAVINLADADGMTSPSYSYQWMVRDPSNASNPYSDISGAQSATYTLGSGDVGKEFQVKVTYTDDGGFANTVTSSSTGGAVDASNFTARGNERAAYKNGTAEIDLLWNDDYEGAVSADFNVEIVSNPSNGSISLDVATGVVLYTPGSDYTGTDSFTYRLVDRSGNELSPAATVSLKVVDTPLYEVTPDATVEKNTAAAEWLINEANERENTPAELVIAHTTADAVYGSIDADAPRVTETVTIELRPSVTGPVFRETKDYYETGLYAAPGELVYIEVPDELIDVGAKFAISTWNDNIKSRGEWLRAPDNIFRKFEITSADITVANGVNVIPVANAFGGLIYLETPVGITPQTVELKIHGAVKAPVIEYDPNLDLTDAAAVSAAEAAIQTILDNSHAPWGILSMGNVDISMPTSALKGMTSPVQVMDWWHRMVDHLYDFAGRDILRPEMISLDVQIGAGFMSAGYPHKVDTTQAEKFVDIDYLTKGSPWGIMHELGHAQQLNDHTLGGDVEVSVNIFSLYLSDVMGSPTLNATAERRVERAEDALEAGGYAEGGNWGKIQFYFQIIAEFGFEPFKRFFNSYNEGTHWEQYYGFNNENGQMDHQSELDNYYIRLSVITQRDLAPHYDAWNFQDKYGNKISAEARDYVASLDLDKWSIVDVLDREETVTFSSGETNPITIDLNDNVWSIDANGPLTFTTLSGSSANGRLTNNADGTFTYDPNGDTTGGTYFVEVTNTDGGKTQLAIAVRPSTDTKINTGKDTKVSVDLPDNSYENDTNLSVDGKWKSAEKVYTLLQFDDITDAGTGTVPANATVLGAKLRIYADQGFASFNIVPLEKDWNDTDSLTDMGGETGLLDYLSSEVDHLTGDHVSFSGGWLEIDVTDRVSKWVADPSTNKGWAFVPGSSGDGTNIYSFEHSTLKPELIVSWESSGSNNAPVVAGSNSLTMDEDTTEPYQTLIINDRDGIASDATFTVSTQASNGQVVLMNDQIDGGTAWLSWHYMPNKDFSGSDSAVVSYVDAKGATQTVNLSMTVNPINDAASGNLYISGNARVGEDLQADVDAIKDPDGIASYSYSWYADGELVARESVGKLTMIGEYEGKTIAAKVLVTDDDGNAVTISSDATKAVVASGADIKSSTTISTGADTKINAANPDKDWSDAKSLIVDGVWEGSQKGYSLIRFEDELQGNIFGDKNSQIPTKATVDSATLRVYATEGYAGFDLVAMKVDWQDTNAWQDLNSSVKPFETSAIEATADGAVGGKSSGGWIEFDVTTRVGDWLDGSATNYGWALVPRDGKYDGTPIHSFEADNGLEPQLVVNWTLPANTDATGDLTINGTLAVGEVLTADVQNVADVDGLPSPLNASYAWLRDGVKIDGATSSTYTLSVDDEGHAISFSYAFVDNDGASEVLVSAVTQPIAKANNSLPTGSVSIDNTSPNEGDTLTVSNNLADTNGMGTIAYQWLRDGVAIDGASATTYSTSQLDVGHAISVRASYVDGTGTNEAVTSSATTAVLNVNDSPVGSLNLEGELAVGETLTVTPSFTDEDGIGSVVYKWYHSDNATDGNEIGTGTSYTLTSSDSTKGITVKASYVDGGSTSESLSATYTGSVQASNNEVTGELVIIKSGTPVTGTTAITGAVTLSEGDVLSADSTDLSDFDTIGSLSYQWYRAGSEISGATSQTYTLAQGDVGSSLTVKVSYTDGASWEESVSSGTTSVVKNVNDAVAGSVTITGTAEQGQTLIATNTLSDEDGMGKVSYQWLKDGSAIYGATGETYTLTQADVSAQISVKATYMDAFGTLETKTSSSTSAVTDINDTPIGVVSISGAAMSGETLKATVDLTDADGTSNVQYSFQWYSRDYVEGATADTAGTFVAVAGANASQLVLADSDVGKEFKVKVSYTDEGGFQNTVYSGITTEVAAVSSYTWLSDFSNSYIYDVVDSFLSDAVLTYKEVLNLIRTVADTGVSSTEYADLQTFYINAVDYFESEYLTTISYNTIYSNPANEKWWGGASSLSQVKTLGDLSAGDSEAKANYLIGKWFLGEDLPMPVVGGDSANDYAYASTYDYATATGAIFEGVNYGDQVATPDDIIQGMAGTCYLLAAMGSIANRNPEYLYDAVTDNGNGTYGVRFYVNGEAVYTTVDMSVPVDSNNKIQLARTDPYGNLDAEMWVTLFEKAYAQLNSQYPYDGQYDSWQGTNSYQAVEGGWADPLEQITNIPFQYYSSYYTMGAGTQINSDFTVFKADIIAALDQGAMAWIATWANTYSGSVREFVSGHAFAVQSYDATTDKFTIRNPWGEVPWATHAAEFEVKLEDVWLTTKATLAITDVPNQVIDQTFNYTFTIDPIQEGENGELVITRVGSGRESTIYIETETGTATDSDFQSIARTPIVFSEFETVKKINIATFSDTLDEEDETFDINVYKTLSDVDAYKSLTVTIENDHVITEHSYSVSSLNDSEAKAAVEGDVMTFIITRDRSGEESTVYVATADGTATSDDYTALAKKAVTFAADELEKSIKIQLTKDQLDESAESVQLLVYTNPGDTVAAHTATGWVKDDELPSISYVIGNDAASETSAEDEGGVITFTIGRNVSGVTSSVVVKAVAETAGFSDFVFADQELTFGANQKEITLEVQIEQDLWLEATEYFTLQVFDPADQSKPVAQSRAYIENVDFSDYQYSLANNSGEFAPVAEGEEITVTISRTNFKGDGTDTVSTVYIEAADLTTSINDIEQLGRIAVKFEAHEDEKTVSYKVYSDRDIEGQESFAVELFRNQADSVAIERTTAYITDGEFNDLVYTLELSDGDAVYYEGDQVEFTVTRSASGEWSSVFLSTEGISAGENDFIALNGYELEFAPHELSKTFTVTTNSDSLSENAESFVVALFLSEGDLQANNAHAHTTATIVDVTSIDDLYNYSIETNSPVNEGDVATFTVRRDDDGSESSIFVRTTFGNTNGKDHEVLELTKITFSEFETEKLIELNTYQDAIEEGVEYFWLEAFESIDAASRGEVLTSASMQLVDATNAASFTYAVNSSLAERTVTEGDDVSFTVTRSGDTNHASHIFVRTSDGSANSGDYQSLALTKVAFAAGETEKTISVATHEDLKTTETNEYFWLDAFETRADAAQGNAVIHAKGIINNDASVIKYSYSVTNDSKWNDGVSEGNSVEFTITRDATGSKSTVYVSTWSGTADEGTDFAAKHIEAVEFAANETEKVVTVDVHADGVVEDSEYFWLVQYDSYEEAQHYQYANYSLAYVSDALDEPNFSYNIKNDNPTNEGETVTFTISRSGDDLSTASTLYVKTQRGNTSEADHQQLDTTAITFAAYEISKTIEVDTYTDGLTETGPEYFWLLGFDNLAQVNSDDAQYYSKALIDDVADASPTVTYTVDDPTVNEGDTATFTITRDNTSGADSVYVATSYGSAGHKDFGKLGAQKVSFADGVATANVSVETFSDNESESTETFKLNVFEFYSDYLEYEVAATGTASITNVANQNANYTYRVEAANNIVDEGDTAKFTITRSGGNASDSTSVWVATGKGSATGDDFAEKTVTEVALTGTNTVTVDIQTFADSKQEGYEYFWFNVFESHADALAHDYEDYDYVYIKNKVSSAATYEVKSDSSNTLSSAKVEGNDIVFTITRSKSDTAESLWYETANGTATAGNDYTAKALTQLDFTIGETSKQITVTTIDDSDVDSLELEDLWLKVYSDSGATSMVANGSGYVRDNDEEITYNYSISSANEGGWANAAYEGENVSVVVKRDGMGTESTMYLASFSGGSAVLNTDYELNSAGDSYIPVVFGANETEKTVNIPVKLDSNYDNYEYFYLASYDSVSDISGGYWKQMATIYLKDQDSAYGVSTVDWQLSDIGDGSQSHPGHDGSSYRNKYAFAALTEDGEVVTWGDANSGGDSSSVAGKLTHIDSIVSSQSAFAAINIFGGVVTWGNESMGGDASDLRSRLDGTLDVTAISSTHGAFAALHSDGTVTAWGKNALGGDNAEVTELTNVSQIFSNSSSFVALHNDGTLSTWGFSSFGGDSSAVETALSGQVVTSITATQSAFAALTSVGEVYTWGSSASGGDSSAVANSLDDVLKVWSNGSSFAAVRKDGSVVTWGDPSSGGNSTAVAAALDGTVNVREIFATSNAFAAVREDGSLVVWGDPAFGGASSAMTAINGLTATVQSVVANQSAFSALLSDGSVYAWGDSSHGGDLSIYSTADGDAVSTLLDGTDDTVDAVEIVATSNGFAALRADGSVVTWGGGVIDSEVSAVLTQYGTGATSAATDIVAADYAFALIDENGNVTSFGDRLFGGDTGSASTSLNSILAINAVEDADIQLNGSAVGDTVVRLIDSNTFTLDGTGVELGNIAGYTPVESDSRLKMYVWDDNDDGIAELSFGLNQSTDSAVDINDVIAQLRHIVGLDTLTGQNALNADNDLSGTVDVSDVVASLRVIVGLDDAANATLVDSSGNSKFTEDALPSEMYIHVSGDVDLSWSSDLV